MQRTNVHIKLENPSSFKKQLLTWAQQFKVALWMDSNEYPHNYTSYDAILAVDCLTKIETTYKNAFQKLKTYKNQCNDYIFGYLGYDLKNDVEELQSTNFDGLGFSDMFFFQPKKLFFIKNNEVQICYINSLKHEVQQDFNIITSLNIHPKKITHKIKIKSRISKSDYLNKIYKILNHIKRGDIYEANFCQEFFDDTAIINPIRTYFNLNSISTPPFASFLKLRDTYLISASPERFLRKEGTSVISQPIKGTAKRSKNNIEDHFLKEQLKNNPKEQSENIMIVDLVRNDLSRIAVKGSVTVDELCKIYSFKQVHQLISTVSCKVQNNTDVVDILKETFPMGSMTGAPKIAAMKIIEDLEITKRGLYSGAVGYITPQNNFDFNVVIRSILYNKAKKYVSFSVGSAITTQSNPETEYDECLLKAQAMKTVLLNGN